MPITMSIRPVAPTLAPTAAAIFRRAMLTVPCFDPGLHSPAEDIAFWQTRIFPHCRVLGAFADDALLGQIAIGEGWVHHLHIDPSSQGHGIGSALLEMVKIQAMDLQLWTFQANSGARRFYERHGFIAVELTDGAATEERLPDVRYRWLR